MLDSKIPKLSFFNPGQAVLYRVLPESMRSSQIAGKNWCEENAKHRVMKMIPDQFQADLVTDALEMGTAIHQVLEDSVGMRFPWEWDMMFRILDLGDSKFGYVRPGFTDGSRIPVGITGHPDEFQILSDGSVSLVEYKTTKGHWSKSGEPQTFTIDKFKICMARFQVQIYCYLMEPYIKQAGLKLGPVHTVQYWCSESLKPIKYYSVTYDPQAFEETMLDFLAFCRGEREARAPDEFKCKCCGPEDKNICPVWVKKQETLETAEREIQEVFG